ncbi:MAG: sulfite exporter TauE/SafE family protein [Ilumatobacteraceae bacterium]
MNLRALLASPFGFLIGLSLGAMGGGGSILAVPVLVYIAGQSAKEATATSLVLVTMTALVGIRPHFQAGRVKVKQGIMFGLAGTGANLLGSVLNKKADANLLLLLFAGVMLAAGAAMWRGGACRTVNVAARSVGAAAATDIAPPPTGFDLRTVVKVILVGSGVGLLTGFFGVGGGFVIVPGLVLALGFSMPDAVGTSLLVIVINSLVALSMRWSNSAIDWAVVLPFAVSSMAGVTVGGKLAGKKEPCPLQRAFVGLLVVVAIYTAIKSALAL